ncbi:MAG: Calx-beta domain-containing protein [Planctomycetaceae bacterium]
MMENNETFALTLSGLPADVIPGSGSGQGTIENEDMPTSGSGSGAGTPTLNVYDGGGSEGSGSGGGTAWFSVSLSSPVATATTVNWMVSFASGQTATAADFPSTGLTGSVTIPANTPSVMIAAPLIDDAIVESPETLTLTVSASGTNSGDLTADGTIYDNEPEISISDWNGSEGSGSGSVTAEFTVTLSRTSTNTVSVDYSTFDGTATDGSDYTGATTTTLTFAPGVTTQTISIPIIDDADVELGGAEIFSVDLTNAIGATITDSAGMGSITDNEPTVTIDDGTGTEGFASRPAKFTVHLDHAVGNDVVVNYTATTETATDDTADGGSDYDNAGGSITILAGDLSAEIVIVLPNDAAPEDTETFTVTLTSATAATIDTDNKAQGTIIDNDAVRDGTGSGSGVSVDDPEVIEGDFGGTQLVFIVTLSMSSVDTVTVDYATDLGLPPDDAYPGTDYTPTSGTLTFAPGETQKTVTVNVTPDVAIEGHETLFLNVSNPVEAFLHDPQGEGLILNDDGAYVWVNDVEVEEDTASLTITLTIEMQISSSVIVSYSTSDVTAQGTGADRDFDATSGAVTFYPNGMPTVTFTIPIIGDSTIEENESFSVFLTPTSNADIAANNDLGSNVVTVTILNNDGPTISINENGSVTESDTSVVQASFTITLSESFLDDVTADYTLIPAPETLFAYGIGSGSGEGSASVPSASVRS